MTMARPREYKLGLRKAGAVAHIVAAGAANAQNLWILSAGRTAKIRKLHIYNGQPAPVQVTIGMGVPLVAAMAPITVVNGYELIITEADLVDVEFTATITVMSSAAGAAPNDVQVQATVEEFQGPTG
jgi:hypothetical protein